MTAQLKELTSMSELDRVLAQSAERPQLIFKHSNVCGISAAAYEELQHHLTKPAEIGYWLVTVQLARDISNEIASRLNIEHESPQAILVRDGKAVWNASHRKITSQTLAEAINSKGV